MPHTLPAQSRTVSWTQRTQVQQTNPKAMAPSLLSNQARTTPSHTFGPDHIQTYSYSHH